MLEVAYFVSVSYFFGFVVLVIMIEFDFLGVFDFLDEFFKKIFKNLTDFIYFVFLCLWVVSLVMFVITDSMIDDKKEQMKINEWNSFVKENQCVLTKMNKDLKDNVWICRNGTLEVISDYFE